MPVRSASPIEHRSEKDEISHRVGGMVEVPGGRAAKFFVGDIVLRYWLPRKHDMDQISAIEIMRELFRRLELMTSRLQQAVVRGRHSDAE